MGEDRRYDTKPGKSALAQTISESFYAKRELAASFFFLRSDPARNNGNYVIPTLASHFVDNLKGIVPFIEDRIRKKTLYIH